MFNLWTKVGLLTHCVEVKRFFRLLDVLQTLKACQQQKAFESTANKDTFKLSNFYLHTEHSNDGDDDDSFQV